MSVDAAFAESLRIVEARRARVGAVAAPASRRAAFT